MKKSVLLLFATSLLYSCSQPKDKFPPETSMEKKSGKIVIYQMMTRLFGNKVTTNKTYGTAQENGLGKFNDVNDAALKGIKELGVTHVWYTGVIEHALLTDYTAFGIPLDDADVVKGRAGSPYSIKDYYDVNPDLAVHVRARMQEFEALVERTHGAGLKVIIDFVPNHVARAYKSDAKPAGVKDLGESDDTTASFKPSNNFYYLPGQKFVVPSEYKSLGRDSFRTKDQQFVEVPAKVTGNDQFTNAPGMNEWFEAVKLNYGVDIQNNRQQHFEPIPDTWIKMKDILIFWAGKKVDGFRCDMAEMVPVQFWNWAIPQVKEVNPEIVFIAEIYNPKEYGNYTQIGKFDMLYDKVQLYDTLRHITQGHGSTANLPPIQDALRNLDGRMMHFIENHDEQRSSSRFFAGSPWKAWPSMVVSATIDRGPVMIYFGQEVGEPGLGIEGFEGDDGRTTHFDYWGVPEHQKWMNGGLFDGALLSDEQKQLRASYVSLLNLAGSQKVFTNGEYADVTQSNISSGNFDGKVAAYVRYTSDERVLVVCSFDAAEKKVRLVLPKELLDKAGIGSGPRTLNDLLPNAVTAELKDGATELTLKPFGAYIFRIN
jgi:glycosidase